MDFELKRAEEAFRARQERDRRKLLKEKEERDKRSKQTLEFQKSIEEASLRNKVLLAQANRPQFVNNGDSSSGSTESYDNPYLKERMLVIRRSSTIDCDADRVILAPSILEELIRNDAPYPYFFRVTYNEGEALQVTTHCGVLEFTGEEGAILMPANMLANVEGQVSVCFAKLPAGRKAAFTPATNRFFDIPDHRAVLENCLRLKRCVLTVNDTFFCYYGNDRYALKVSSVSPGDAVTIINTDMEVEVVPLIVSPLSVSKGLGVNSGRIPINGVPLQGCVLPNSAAMYFFHVIDTTVPVVVKVDVAGADADVFVTEPSNLVLHPSILDFDFANVVLSSSKTITISPPRSGTYHLAVAAAADNDVACNYSLSVTQEKQGISSITTGSSSSSGGDTRLCGNCKQEIAAANYQLHTLHCERNLRVCPKCTAVFPKKGKEIDKHMRMAHSVLTCDCGFQAELAEMALHRRSQCILRLTLCRFCGLVTVFGDARGQDAHDRLYNLTVHESECGSRTASCDLCGKTVMLKQIDYHKQLFHGHNSGNDNS